MLEATAEDGGAVAAEYALMASLIAVVIGLAVAQLGGGVAVIFADAAALI